MNVKEIPIECIKGAEVLSFNKVNSSIVLKKDGRRMHLYAQHELYGIDYVLFEEKIESSS